MNHRTLTAYIAIGENKHPTKINFANWLNGQALSTDTLFGQLDTELTFATY